MSSRSATMLLGVVYAAVFSAAVVAPYDPAEQHRDLALAPPARIHLFDRDGRLQRPFVYSLHPAADGGGYAEDLSRRYPVHLFSSGRLVRVDEPAHLFLAGADAFG